MQPPSAPEPPKTPEEARPPAVIAWLRTQLEDAEAFNRSVAHDLKGALLSIRGFAELAQGELTKGRPERTMEHLTKLGRSCQRVEQIVHDLLHTACLRA